MYKRHKYRAEKKIVDEIRFDSKKEAKRYQELKLLQQAGEVDFFLRQVPLHLPGKTKLVVDFLVFYHDGHVAFEDPKGYLTDTARIKIAQAEELYGIHINLL